MRVPCHGAWVLGLGVLLGSALTAQDPHSAVPQKPLSTPPSSRLDDFATVQQLDGTLWGAGQNYKIHFDAESVEFTPMLGTAAPRNMPVRLTLSEIGRGATAIPAAKLGAPALSAKELRVEYARGFVTERYDVRVGDVEQSFVFDRLPAGNGDLIVRMQLDTELTPVGDGKTLDLQWGEHGSVHIGAVTGIDARGMRAEGTVRYVDGHLELGLPAEFVDSATLPLVLDPTLGSEIQVSSDLTVADEQDPDIAYDRTSDDYLCVWERRFSASDYDIVGQRFSSSGAKIGGALLLESDGLIVAFDGRVANQNANDMWVVVWVQNSDIYGRAVRSSDGAVGAIRAIVTGTDTQIDPALASESSFADDDVVMVYENTTQTTIEARTIHANETTLAIELPAPGIVTIDPADPGWNDYDPEISSHGGENGIFLVVWRRYFSSSAQYDIRAKIIDRQLNLLTGFAGVTNTAGTSEANPSCDGDGQHWVIAYERPEAASPGDSDILARSLIRTQNGNATLGTETNVAYTAVDDENRPNVAWLGDAVLISWSDELTSPNYEIYAGSRDPFNCTSCEGDHTIANSTLAEDYAVIASRFAGGASTNGGAYLKDDAFIVWEARDTTTSNSEVRGRRYTAADGSVSDQGGGCGAGGEAYAGCPNTPHSGFEFRLHRAEPSRNSWLIMSPGRRDFVCGPCSLVADPFFGIVIGAGTTDGNGNNSLAVAIPSSSALVGAHFYMQWLTGTVAPACGTPAVDMSNALYVTID